MAPVRHGWMMLLLLMPAAVAPLFAQQTPQFREDYQSPPEKLPRQVPVQPISFSHRLHAAQGIDCVRCHPDASKRFEAGLPSPSDCTSCHRSATPDKPDLQKLIQLATAGVEVEWVPVYDSPSYVIFSHRKHVRAGEACETCHGDVTQFDALPQEISINMTACMNCHEQRGAKNKCFWCHELEGF